MLAVAETYMSDDPDDNPLATMALFSALGLLASLIAILAGVRDNWF